MAFFTTSDIWRLNQVSPSLSLSFSHTERESFKEVSKVMQILLMLWIKFFDFFSVCFVKLSAATTCAFVAGFFCYLLKEIFF